MADDHARAFWTVAAGRGEIREEPLAAPDFGDVVVQTAYSGISRGTELLVHAPSGAIVAHIEGDPAP
jgi:hypothetical protein